jgi:general secretion pathway protein A
VVLIIDDAQNMPIETLENLRMLSNLETSTDKLIQMVLVGQPEFVRILNVDQLRQLDQRIAIRCTIIPFTQEESLAYIKHRLAKVAMDESPVFTKGALKKIVKRAKGIPRSLNILCDNTLITGFGYEKKPVNIKIVKEVMADFENKARPSLLRWVLAPAASILLIAGLFLIYPSRDLSLPKLENPVLSLTTAQSQREEAMKPSMESPGLSRIDQSAPVEEKIEREEEKIQPESEKSYTLTQRVKKGDNLSRLTKKVYGHADDKLIERVKQNNPRIKDVNHIKAGDEIVFPEIGENQVKSKG